MKTLIDENCIVDYTIPASKLMDIHKFEFYDDGKAPDATDDSTLYMFGGVHSDTSEYLTVDALSDGVTVSFNGGVIAYSSDGVQWNTLFSGETSQPISSGESILVRGVSIHPTQNGIGTFNIRGDYGLSGTCMSMLYDSSGRARTTSNDISTMNAVFMQLFKDSTTLRYVSEGFLPSENISPYCYYEMFSGCTNMTVAPSLPAINVPEYAYCSMFEGCSSLKMAPVMNISTITGECACMKMFKNCTSIIEPPVMALSNVTSQSCYEMFMNCTSLTSTPELTALTLTSECYTRMFYNCTKLSTATLLSLSAPSTRVTMDWMYGVSVNGTFYKSASAMWENVTGTSYIPANWNVILISDMIGKNI